MQIFPKHLHTLACIGAFFISVGSYNSSIDAKPHPRLKRPTPLKKVPHLRLKHMKPNNIVRIRTAPPKNVVVRIRKQPVIKKVLSPRRRRAMLAYSNLELAFKVYKGIQKTHAKRNVVYSPYSIAITLAMVYKGARKQTRKELAKLLSLRMHPSHVDAAYADVLRLLEPPTILKITPPKFKKSNRIKTLPRRKVHQEPLPFQLVTANTIWVKKRFRILKAYQNALSSSYQSKVARLNFRTSEKARRHINAWVSRKTQRKIRNLLPKGSIHPYTRVVLTNAIYFKSRWSSEFNKRDTRKKPFWITARRRRYVRMMHQTNWFTYTPTKHAHVLQIPYKYSVLSMVAIVPKQRDGLALLQKTITPKKLNRWIEDGVRRYIRLSMPKFKLRTRLALTSLLKRLGVRSAFTHKADLSGITGKRNLRINRVIHQGYIDVHEKGTEAAAATAVTVAILGGVTETPKRMTIQIDRPFLFGIRHHVTGQFLFLGHIIRPSR